LRFRNRRVERRQAPPSKLVSLLPPCRGPPTAFV
jgi:hypothetical protein